MILIMLPSRNIHVRPVDSDVLRLKLAGLLEDVLSRVTTGETQTESEFLSDFSEALSKFEFYLLERYIELPFKVEEGTLPLAEKNNELFNAIWSELSTLLRQTESVETLTVSNFNDAVSFGNRVVSDTKKLASDLSVLLLYSKDPLGLVNHLSDSFGNLEQVEYNSPLIETEQCSVNLEEGVVTLPERTSEIVYYRVGSSVINLSSNGLPGNNYDLLRPRNSDITKIYDGNPDTWFEYERVTFVPEAEPLVLDINLILDRPSIVNYIKIVPFNFGLITPFEIVSMDTSLTGEDWRSVKDSVPLADYKDEDPENVFTLSPATSRVQSEGHFTFTPRTVKYIHLKIIQKIPYETLGAFGRRQRYALGIRDIQVAGKKYKPKGELISKVFNLGKEIKKVSLRTAQNPTEISVLADIKHSVSFDDGGTWFELQPQNRGDNDVPEVLDTSELNLGGPVTSLKYRAAFERDSEKFNEVAIDENVELASKLETFNVPVVAPHTLQLSQIPIEGTLEVFNPFYGSVGKKQPKLKLGVGTGGNELMLPIPDFIWDTLEGDMSKIQVYVDGSLWRRIGSFTATDPWVGGAIAATSRVYYIDTSHQVVFGDGTGTKGKVPPAGAVIGLTLTREQLHFSAKEPFVGTLNFPADTDKSTVKLRSGGNLKRMAGMLLPPGATKNFLGKKNIQPFAIVVKEYDLVTGEEVPTVFTSEQTFIDGTQENTTNGFHSVDYENGFLYSKLPVSSSLRTLVWYFYYDFKDLALDEWDFLAGDNQTIEIKPSAYKTTDRIVNSSSITSGSRFIQLEPFVVPNSVGFPTGAFDPVLTEVEFVDGVTELSSAIKVEDEAIPYFVGSGVVSFTLVHGSKMVPGYGPLFSDTDLFVIEKEFVDGSAELVSDGDYSVDYNGLAGSKGTVYAQLPAGEDTTDVTVSYFFEDADIALVRQSAYSVDYKKGKLFLGKPWTFTSGSIVYKTAEFDVQYNIAKNIEGVELTPGSKVITLPDSLVSESYVNTDLGYRNTVKARYQYNKNRSNTLKEYEPYFSPILKDYTLGVVDKDQLFFG